METRITPDYAKNLESFTEGFLCDIKANIYEIKFRKFRVRELDSDFVLFEVSDESERKEEANGVANNNNTSSEASSANEPETLENSPRVIRYHLGPEFLDLKNIGTSLTFSVGSQPVKNLLMIERHYFKGRLIKSFEFKFDFCIPNSTNTWETIYTIPDIEPEVKEEMINSPWETKSDSFYFVENNLIMHHKALYNYSPID